MARAVVPTLTQLEEDQECKQEALLNLIATDLQELDIESLRELSRNLKICYNEVASLMADLVLKYQSIGSCHQSKLVEAQRQKFRQQYKTKIALIVALRQEEGDKSISSYASSSASLSTHNVATLGEVKGDEKTKLLLDKTVLSAEQFEPAATLQGDQSRDAANSAVKSPSSYPDSGIRSPPVPSYSALLAALPNFQQSPIPKVSFPTSLYVPGDASLITPLTERQPNSYTSTAPAINHEGIAAHAFQPAGS